LIRAGDARDRRATRIAVTDRREAIAAVDRFAGLARAGLWPTPE
jgi:hypothetical protein